MKPILLATQSPYKMALFQRLSLPFETVTPPFEERWNTSEEPGRVAERLALGKAESLAHAYPHHLIIGSDQVLSLDGKIFSKPGTTENAVQQLLELRGKAHLLHTAFALLEPLPLWLESGLVTSELVLFADLSVEYLQSLVVADQTQDCVGGYKFESQGIVLFERVQTPDPNAIVGLPLLSLIGILRGRGYFPSPKKYPGSDKLTHPIREKKKYNHNNS